MMHNKKLLLHYVYAIAVTVMLAAVFAAYLQPDFLVVLANQIWLCF